MHRILVDRNLNDVEIYHSREWTHDLCFSLSEVPNQTKCLALNLQTYREEAEEEKKIADRLLSCYLCYWNSYPIILTGSVHKYTAVQ